MTNRILVLFSITIVSILSSTAQIPITSKNNWMYVDASFLYGDKSFPISAMIDTGCTYCVIDSTFAVDSCGITPQNPDYNGYNTSRDRTRIFYTTIPILCVGGKEFTEVKCAIIDLSGKFQTNHRFYHWSRYLEQRAMEI